MVRSCKTCFLILLLVFNPFRPVQANPFIRLGYIEFPPVFFTNSEGKPEGSLIDLADLVMTRAGYEWKAYSRPTRRMAVELAEGKLDLWIGLSTLPEFQKTTLVGEPVVFTIELNSYWFGNKAPIKKKEDLRAKRIVTMHGYSYGGWVNFINNPVNAVQECKAFTHEQAIQMLKYERCDYLLNYSGPMKSQLQALSIENLNHHRISALDAKFVVSLKNPHAQSLLRNLEHAYHEVVDLGLWEPPR